MPWDNSMEKGVLDRLSLGNGEQRVEVTLLLHQLVKAALLGDVAVLQREQAGAAAQDVLVQIVIPVIM